MRWHLAKFSLFISCLSLPALADSVDKTRLWLPTSYKTLYLPLKEAAQTANRLERCLTVLEGTVDLEQSRPGHPIFRILCRQENGRNYNEMVDGISFTTLTTVEIPPKPLSAEEQERLEQEEQARQQAEREAHHLALWQACAQALEPLLQNMMELAWLTPAPPQATKETDTHVVFDRDFDAKDVWGKNLHYRAICRAEDPEQVELRIIPRPE